MTRRRKGPADEVAAGGGGESLLPDPAAAERAADPAAAGRTVAPAGDGGGSSSVDAAARIELPRSGLAAEVLASLATPVGGARGAGGGESRAAGDDGGEPGGDPQPPGHPRPAAPGAGGAPPGRERVYSFADALERRGQEAREEVEQPESWVVFELARESYGLPVASVQEILRVGTITRVPDAPAPVRGITNLRGKVLAIVDLRVRLGLPAAELDARSRILVIDSRQRVLGLLVDAALQVSKLLPSALAAPPRDVMTVRSDYIRGVYHCEDQLIIALDVDRVLLIHDVELAPGPAAAPGEERAE